MKSQIRFTIIDRISMSLALAIVIFGWCQVNVRADENDKLEQQLVEEMKKEAAAKNAETDARLKAAQIKKEKLATEKKAKKEDNKSKADEKPADVKKADDDKKSDSTEKKDEVDSEKKETPVKDKTEKKEKASEANEVASATPTPPKPISEDMEFYLMNSKMVIVGKIALKEIAIVTDFGSLQVPIANIRSFTPGLNSHPSYNKQVGAWIKDLGSSNFNDREKAQNELVKIAPTIRAELEKFRGDTDTERRNRVIAILGDLEDAAEDSFAETSAVNASVQQRDIIETQEFTIAGKIVPQTFEITSQYGVLNVQLSDIKRAQREMTKKDDINKTYTVTAANFAMKNPLNTNIRLERGDRVSIKAEGRLFMQPWGNNASTTPEGSTQYGNFMGSPAGALMGRMGNDQFFKIGSKYEHVVDKPGILNLAIAMQNDYNESQFNGKYTVKIKVIKKP